MDQLIKFVEDYKASNPTGWRKWVFGSLAVLAVLLIVLVFTVRETLRQKEIAALKHERDMLQIRAHQQTVDSEIESLETKKAEHVKAADAAQRRANELSRRVDMLEAQHQQNLEIINSIRSWDDVDARIR
jgi:flagellar biosynthesis/type III secretory pathway M-ring protein FliF/YscJ